VDEGYVQLQEGKRIDRMALRVIQLLNGYLRATLAMKRAELT
jgi:hypothetical protein